MSRPTSRRSSVLAVAMLALMLAGCTTSSSLFGPSQPTEPPPPPVTPTLPPAFPPQDLIGRWGLAAYHRDEDRGRTEAAAVGQCRQPYVIGPGPTGGVMMHLADQATPTELKLKGAPGGKTYVGLGEDPPGSQQDREVVSFDGRVLILRWMDSEVQGRYGTMVYVRCGPEGAKKPAKPKPKAKTAAKPKPKPAAKPTPAPKPTQ